MLSDRGSLRCCLLSTLWKVRAVETAGPQGDVRGALGTPHGLYEPLYSLSRLP